MPDLELRDSTTGVDVELPNGFVVRGRPIYFRTGMTIQGLMDAFVHEGTQESFDRMFDAFSRETGITEQQIKDGCPTVTISEIMDLIRRFIYLLRPGRTAVQASRATPGSITAPDPKAAPPRRKRAAKAS